MVLHVAFILIPGAFPQEDPGGPGPFLERHCLDCHGRNKPKGELDLSGPADDAAIAGDRDRWKKVWERLHAREMPPKGKPQPADEERRRVLERLQDVLSRPRADGTRDPGRATMRRLTRIEYNNTLYDLLRIHKPVPHAYFQPQRGMPEEVRIVLHRHHRPLLADLPPDDAAHGYDTVGDALSLPPFLLEKYLAAGAKVVGQIKRLDARDGPRAFVEEIGLRAFRRPPTPDEIDRYAAVHDRAVAAGAAPDEALRITLQALLVSPHFLFKVEADRPGGAPAGVRPLDDWELAVRLSYFLWSTMPDDELFRLAREGRLRDPATLEQQARRMLRSPKAKELSESFALQWLQVAGVETLMPDPDRYPAFYGKETARAMKQEVLLLFETVLVEDRSVLDLVDADFAWLDPQLARLYGVDFLDGIPRGASLIWKRYALPDKRRGGVLGTAAVLAATSVPTRTSAVKRGKWILETLFAAPPPPPLPDVADINEAAAGAGALSLRERFERHRADPRCASCHDRMDPLGFGLENYDAIGAWRDNEGGRPIDASGTLPDGTSFTGPMELKALLRTRYRDDVVRGFVQHLMTYALGRKVDFLDAPVVAGIVQAAARDGHRFSRIVVEIVASHPFRHRRTRDE